MTIILINIKNDDITIAIIYCLPKFSKLSIVLIINTLLLFSRYVMSDSLQPHRLAYQAPLSMEFPRQEYWSGLPFPSPGNLPHPGIELRSPALQVDSLPSECTSLC